MPGEKAFRFLDVAIRRLVCAAVGAYLCFALQDHIVANTWFIFWLNSSLGTSAQPTDRRMTSDEPTRMAPQRTTSDAGHGQSCTYVQLSTPDVWPIFPVAHRRPQSQAGETAAG